MTWWARRKGAFAHPTNWNFKQQIQFRDPAARSARDFAQKFRALKSADSVGWAKRSVPTAFASMTWWARRKGAFAHPTNWNFKQQIQFRFSRRDAPEVCPKVSRLKSADSVG